MKLKDALRGVYRRIAGLAAGNPRRRDRADVRFVMPEFDPRNMTLPEWIRLGIEGYKEWYQPIDFGGGLIAHVTSPPDWKPDPSLDAVRGMAKWHAIVRKHLPELRGRRVLDLGCSAGLFSLQMAREGAAGVVGIDRDRTILQKTAAHSPWQDVVGQANFVKKAFELLEGRTFPVRYIAADFRRLGDLDLGRFDLVVALCVVYHELEEAPALIRRLSTMTDHLVLQTCLLHQGDLARWADPQRLAALLREAGFDRVVIDAPKGYDWPMITGEGKRR